MKKKIILSLLILSLVLNWTSCSHVEDTNGSSDYSIVTYSDKDIITKNSFLLNNSVKTSKNEINNISAKKFSGVYQLEKTKVDNQNIYYHFESKIESGNFKIVIIHGEKIIKEIEINSITDFTIDSASGTYLLKIVGESARFSLTYSIVTK